MVKPNASTCFKILAVILAGALPVKVATADVVVAVGHGDWGDANIKAYVEPFEKETGIKVVRYQGDGGLAGMRLQQESKNVEVDVWNLSTSWLGISQKNGWVQKIDYGLYKPEQLDKIYKGSKLEYGVGSLYYSIVMSYNADTFKGRAAPSNWAEFWDVQKFPGRRTLRNGALGGGVWEIALLADGVEPSKLYPIDTARAIKSLDRIKPHVTAWWRDGSDGQQLFADKIVDIGPAFNGRIGNLQKQGMNLKMEWTGGILVQDFWAVAAGAKNSSDAQKFIAFATRADRQADFARRIPYGPTNAGAYDLLEPAIGEQLPSHPKNIERQITISDEWYSAVDSAGKSNLQKMNELWTRWSAR